MTGRLASVDAFRGITVAAMLLVNDPGDWGHVYGPLQHASWDGCTPTDLVFPFFLFIVGVSITLAGVGSHGKVLVRALRMVALGLALHALAHWILATPSFRPFGVLQRIGICYAAAGLLAIDTKPRTQWIVIGALLLGFWALMAWGGPLTKEGNLASRVDTALLGRHAYEFDAATGRGHEPEGLLSTLPAIATTLLGVRAGEWLRRDAMRPLLWMGAIALGLGLAWSLVFPLNKNLWSSSYVLWTGGWAMLALAAFHETMDRHRWPAIGRRFGVNAIAIYAGAWLMECVMDAFGWKSAIYGAIARGLDPYAASLAFAIAFVAVCYGVAFALDRRRIHIRV